MRLRLTAIVPVAIVLVTATNVMAELKLPAMFTSGAVLQQKMPVPVWGTANPGDKVSVEFAGQQKTATADQDGKWIVKLDSLKMSKDPAVLTVSSVAHGTPSRTGLLTRMAQPGGESESSRQNCQCRVQPTCVPALFPKTESAVPTEPNSQTPLVPADKRKMPSALALGACC